MILLGGLLVVFGCIGLAYQGASFLRKKTLVDGRPLQISPVNPEAIWAPPLAVASILIAGIILLAL
jgi:hypothetical protein